jgi:diguanylate cyclase (GGDEF)-like protein
MLNSLLNTLEVPEPIFASWQNVVDLLAEVADVPAALIMRVNDHSIKVFRRSTGSNNPYKEADSEPLGQGLYCETVISTQKMLTIPDATKGDDWNDNPDLALGMLAYCGVPLNWPNGTPFGTICILDNTSNEFGATAIKLLQSFRMTLEAQLETIYQQRKLQQLNKELHNRVRKRTHDLAQLNFALTQEIDRRKAAEQEITYQQQHDSGTGFLNRSSFLAETDRLIESCREGGTKILVIFIGITNGRQVQKKHGHETFDQLLTLFRQHFTRFLPSLCITGRPSSIDLAIAVRKTNKADIETLVTHILDAGSQGFQVEGAPAIHLSINIGVACQHSADSEELDLISKAQEAMLSCRDTGNRYAFHNQRIELKHATHNRLESYLLQAVRNDDITLFFQPKVSPINGEWTGAEALLRWDHPELGQVSSELLIKMLEDNGLIFEVGNYVLRSAIEQASEWHKHLPHFKMAVNVSSVQLKNPQFAEQVQQLLSVYSLPSIALELELTESTIIADEYLASKTLNTLHDMGVGLALDDFGTGYASFNYLKKYPFDTIKIDKSFLSQWNDPGEGLAIVRSIISIAKKLKLAVVMEGIENEAQQKLILEEGADLGQGFYYGKPMPKTEFEQHLIEQTQLPTIIRH